MVTNTLTNKLFLVAIVGLGLAIAASQAVAQPQISGSYTDRIHLKNGDTITGDIKELDRGKLRFKTLTMDTVYINWVDIESIEASRICGTQAFLHRIKPATLSGESA